MQYVLRRLTLLGGVLPKVVFTCRKSVRFVTSNLAGQLYIDKLIIKQKSIKKKNSNTKFQSAYTIGSETPFEYLHASESSRIA